MTELTIDQMKQVMQSGRYFLVVGKEGRKTTTFFDTLIAAESACESGQIDPTKDPVFFTFFNYEGGEPGAAAVKISETDITVLAAHEARMKADEIESIWGDM